MTQVTATTGAPVNNSNAVLEGILSEMRRNTLFAERIAVAISEFNTKLTGPTKPFKRRNEDSTATDYLSQIAHLVNDQQHANEHIAFVLNTLLTTTHHDGKIPQDD